MILILVSAPETWIFHKSQINVLDADAMAPYVARSPTTMVLSKSLFSMTEYFN